MKTSDIQQMLQNQRSHLSGNGNYILNVNINNNSITIWEISRALKDGKSRLTNADYQRLQHLSTSKQPDEIKSTDNNIWIGPFNKFEALGFAYFLSNNSFIKQNKTFSIDFSKM